MPVVTTAPDVGNRLRQARLDKGWSPERLGEEIGASKSSIDQWEYGNRYPSGIYFLPIYNALGITPNELLGMPRPDLPPQENPPPTPEPVRKKSAAHKDTEPFNPCNLKPFSKQSIADKDIESFISETHPRELYLIQYSSLNVNTLMQTFDQYALPKQKPQIFLLLKHIGVSPVTDDKARGYRQENVNWVEPYQFRKTRTQLETLLDIDNKLFQCDIHIRCYYAPPAMRAAYIGYPLNEKLRSLDQNRPASDKGPSNGLLSLSGYRHTGQKGGVEGKNNPLLHVRSNTPEGETYYNYFEETFMDLWNNSESGESVLRAIEAAENK